MHSTCISCRIDFSVPACSASRLVECPGCGEVMLQEGAALRVATPEEMHQGVRLLGVLKQTEPRGGGDETVVSDPEKILSEASGVILRVDNGPLQGSLFVLPLGTAIIGRGQGDVQLDDSEVSRRHCALDAISSSRISIRDLASSNGTWVNEIRIGAVVRLSAGDQIRCGETRLTILVPAR